MRTSNRSSDGFTRRTVLVGAGAGLASLGLAKGSQALAMSTTPPAPEGAAPDPAAPEAFVAGALPPREPGLHYAAYSQYDFQPQLSISGRTNSSLGSYCPSHPGNTENLIAPLHLPDRAVLRSVVWTVHNSYTSQPACLAYRPHSGDPGWDVAVETTRSTGLQVAVLTVTPPWSVDNTAGSYFLWIPTGVGSGWQVSVWGAQVAYTPPALALVPLARPGRVYDSRLGDGKLRGGQSRTISVARTLEGAEIVPAGTGAVTFTLTLDQTEQAGWLSVFPSNVDWPGTSSINWYESGQIVANGGTVTLSADRTVTVLAGGGATDFLLDVMGIYS